MSKTDRSKEHLIVVATQLFAERGLRGVTVRDIASEAGVSHSMIFRHFGGLDGLITAAFQYISERIGRSSKIFEPLPDMVEIKALVDGLADNRALVHMFIHGLLEQDHRFEDPDHLAFKRLVAGLDKKKAAGELPANIDSQMLTLSSISMALGWLLIEPSVPDLICEPELDQQSYRHKLLDMWAEIMGL